MKQQDLLRRASGEFRIKEQKRPTLHARRGWVRRLFGDLLFVSKRDRKWWVLPLILLLLILAILLALAVALGPLAPFIYPLV